MNLPSVPPTPPYPTPPHPTPTSPPHQSVQSLLPPICDWGILSPPLPYPLPLTLTLTLTPPSCRQQLEGIDAATNIPPPQLLPCHNEMAYNPTHPSRIAFFCVRPSAEGGESILCKNAELAALLPADVAQPFRDKGGVLYRREYGDRAVMARETPGPGGMGRWFASWQERTGTEDRGEAVRWVCVWGMNPPRGGGGGGRVVFAAVG
jgi:hypothetical protein